MKKENLVILNNEKIFEENGNFYCENLDLKVVPEGLNNYFDVSFIVRSSKKKGGQKINLNKIFISNNIFLFLYNIFKTFKISSKYLIISITPYTFIACIFLYLFRKKVYLYLWSDGYEEWRHLIGKWAVFIFHIMYKVCTFNSEIIVCNKRLTNKKSHLISISRLDESWTQNRKKVPIDKIKYLYVGRVSKEKGIIDFVEMFKNLNFDRVLNIAGVLNNHHFNNPKIKYLGYVSDAENLMKIYDENNLTILPSYTEGYPYVIDESLARGRPVIIFEDISYVVNNKKGIFISKRDIKSFEETTNYIIKNYSEIYEEILTNTLPTRKSMLKQISDIISG